MKKLLLVITIAVAAVSGYAQGVVSINTAIAGGPRATNSTTGQPLQLNQPTDTYLAQLYWAAGQNMGESSLIAVTNASATFGTSASLAGFILTSTRGGNRILPVAGDVTVQIRAWSANGGGTYEAALAVALGGNPAVIVGKTTTVNSVATTGLNTPGSIVAPGFSLAPAVVPEPSSIALGLLGLGAIALFRRRK